MTRHFRRPVARLLFNLAAPLSILVFASVIWTAPHLLETPLEVFMNVTSAFGRWIGELMVSTLQRGSE